MKFLRIDLPPERRRVLLKIGLVVIFAYVLTFLLESRHFLNDYGKAWQFVWEHRLVFRYSALIMGLSLMLLSAIFRKPWTSIGIMTAIVIIVGFVHISKFEQRSNPLLPEDFLLADQAGTVANFVDFGDLIRVLIAVVLVFVLTALLNHLTERILPVKKSTNPSWRKRHSIALRVAVAAIAIVGLLVTTDAPWLETYFMAWNQTWNYDLNGFILGFLYNLGKFELQQPAGYSEEKMQEIAEKYAALKEQDTGRQPLAKADYNIIVVLNESFYDPAIIRDYYHHDGEVVPELHKITAKYSSGQMYSTDYGGGTANIEFEVNTGLSNYWADTVPYTDILPRIDDLRAIASFTKQNGYKTTAIHPYNGGMYKRNYTLPKQGFDRFIDKAEMEFTEHEHNKHGEIGEIIDRSAYNQALKVLRENTEKQMIGIITMQNHAPYPADLFDETTFEVSAKGENEEALKSVETFMNMVHRSDAYLGEFIEKLDVLDEKVVVLFYGDHAPGVFPKVIENKDQKVRNLARLTPYFIYANFDLPKIELPTTTPNCLANMLYNVLNVQKPTLNYLLDEICVQTPILSGFYLGKQGPFQSTELSEYEMINYDILGGEQYWYRFAAD